MQVGSIVEYIGGNDLVGQKLFELHLNTPYVVTELTEGKFKTFGWCHAIKIDAAPNYIAFRIDMFKELAPPEEVNIQEILAEPLLI